jgi:hypothetical protein
MHILSRMGYTWHIMTKGSDETAKKNEADPAASPEDSPLPRSVAIDQYYLFKIGLFRDGAEIKVEDSGMYAVPVRLSADEGRFLLVLSPKEQKHFEKFLNVPSRLFLRKRFQRNPNADPVLIRINTRIVSIEPLSQNENLCIFTLAFKTPPDAWNDLFASLVLDEDLLLERYRKSATTPWQPVPVGKLSLLRIEPDAVVRMADGEMRKAKMVALCPHSGEFFIDSGGIGCVPATEHAIRFIHERYSFYIRGKVESVRPSAEVSGFSFVTFSLPFHPALVELLSTAANMKVFGV